MQLTPKPRQVESEKDTTLNRPRIGESRVWELQQKMEEILGAVTGGDKIQDIHLFAFPSAATIADTLNLASQAGSATQAAKGLEARARLQSLRLRFSPNSRLTSELPVLRPVLVALQIQAASTSSTSTLALSLCEAESIRWILETESGDVRASFLLHSISEAPMFEAPGPIMAEHHAPCLHSLKSARTETHRECIQNLLSYLSIHLFILHPSSCQSTCLCLCVHLSF